ncbi:MAG: aryl-sulfate sulfotransferase [Bacteroidia bacterium]|nr:aryl-sulfate sulfotransferase [Bacteroidia bacterium]
MKSYLQRNILLMALTGLVTINANAQKWGNNTLYATQNGTAAFLMDTTGAITHSWTFSSSAKTGYSTYLLQGGTLLRTVARAGNSFNGGPICGEFQKVDWNGNITWDFIYSTTAYCTHHDICPMPNGNVLVIAYEAKTASEVSAAGCSQSIVMWPDKIVEIQQTGATTGSVVWEWHVWDHLVQSVDPNKANYQTSVVNHPELLNINYATQKDWMHVNGLDYNPMLDQISFSSHNLNEMYIIDHSTSTAEAASHSGGNSGKGGDFLYRYGNPAAYGASGATVLNVVHDAHWIPEGVPNAGYLVGFVNRGVSNTQSSVDQVITPKSGYNYTITPGSAFTPASYSLRHPCNGYTSNQGNSQQLPNGNMLVCMAFLGTFYEINPAGTTLWSKNIGGTLVHAYRYSDCYLTTTAPALPVVTETAGILYATSGATYQWYFNGVLISGANTASYAPTQNGNYLVRITDANNCGYYYSGSYKFSNGTSTNITNVLNNPSAFFKVYPNPTNGILSLDVKDLDIANLTLKVYDQSGRLLMQASQTQTLNLSELNSGLYLLNISTENGISVNKKITLVK